MGTQAVELSGLPSALLYGCAGEPFPFLLDGQSPASWGNGTAYLGFRPSSVLRVETAGEGVVRRSKSTEIWSGDPFDLLERFCAAHLPATGQADGRIVVVALNYDLRRCIERFAQSPVAQPPLPLLVAAAYDWLLSYSYHDGTFLLETSADTAPAEALIDRLRRAPVATTGGDGGVFVRPETARSRHEAAIRQVLDCIAAGDVYQVNVAHRFAGQGRFHAPSVFAGMQRRNAVPFAAYADLDDCVLLSNSPECFLTRDGRFVRTFPIKGTRRRGTDPGEDERLSRLLTDDMKERAEHVMVVDLERNDLGRVCRPGSVHVQELAGLQSFPGLHHMTSAVTGELRKDVGLADLLRATFPGGSVTGAPKIRAMQIIDTLEPFSRGFYTGALGYIRSLEQMVLSLTIRTAMARGDRIWYWAGGGIVADSVPEAEYDETMLKAHPFLEAIHAP